MFNTKFSGTPVTTQCETIINYDWGSGSPANVPANNYAAVWVGKFNFLTTKAYVFTANADDSVRIFVDNEIVVNSWGVDGYKTNQGTQTLTAGEHTVRVEYIEDVGNAKVTVSWQ